MNQSIINLDSDLTFVGNSIMNSYIIGQLGSQDMMVQINNALGVFSKFIVTITCPGSTTANTNGLISYYTYSNFTNSTT